MKEGARKIHNNKKRQIRVKNKLEENRRNNNYNKSSIY